MSLLAEARPSGEDKGEERAENVYLGWQVQATYTQYMLSYPVNVDSSFE